MPSVNNLALDPATRKLYVATGDSGVLSIEAGRRWTVSPQAGLPADHVSWIKFDPRNPSRVFVQVESAPIRIYESRDGGRTWRVFATNLGVSGLTISDLTFDPVSPNVLYAEGAAIPNPNDTDEPFERSMLHLLADPFDPDTTYALASDIGGRHPVIIISRVFVSHNDGRTWSELPIDTNFLSFDPNRPGTFYALSNGIRRTTDGGRTWQEVNSAGLQALTGLVVDQEDPDTLYVSSATQGVLRSTDGGATWAPINAGLLRRGLTDIRSLVGHPTQPHVLYAVSLQGLFEGFWPDR